jgi:transglutaminase-like putative cysteine protease
MTILTVHHVTTYTYKRAVSFGEHRVMFRPRDSYDQRLLESQLTVTPKPQDVRWMLDVFGNCVAVVRFDQRAPKLKFECLICLDHTPVDVAEFPIDESAKIYPFSYSADEMLDLGRFMQRQFIDPQGEVDQWAKQFIDPSGRTDTWEILVRMTQTIKESFAYSRRAEMGIQDPLTTLGLRRGSCRDFALFMMEAVRALGLAARFISGYLYVPHKAGRKVIGGGSTHAWLEVYLAGAGWVEFDPTNGIVGNQNLIRVAVARDPAQASPIHGTWTGFPGDSLAMTVEVNVISQDLAGAYLSSPA